MNRSTLLRCLALVAPLALVGHVRADAVRISGMWVADVTIQGVNDGRLAYATATGNRVEIDAARVQGLRFTRYPAYEQALAAAEAGRHAEAVRLLEEVRDRSRQAWVDQVAEKRLVTELAASGRVVDAVRQWLRLAQGAADAWFVPDPPVEAVHTAGDTEKAQVRELVTPALPRATDDHRPALQALLTAASAGEAASAAGNDAPEPESAPPPPPAESAILLPARVPANPIVDLLRRGAFGEALDLADAALQQPGDLPLKLYLKGMAQLGLAEASGDEGGYKDAGLSFMRVLVYFPRSALAGYARVEVGHVHAQIGRPDQARKLYDQARLEIDESEDPAYHARVIELASQL